MRAVRAQCKKVLVANSSLEHHPAGAGTRSTAGMGGPGVLRLLGAQGVTTIATRSPPLPGISPFVWKRHGAPRGSRGGTPRALGRPTLQHTACCCWLLVLRAGGWLVVVAC